MLSLGTKQLNLHNLPPHSWGGEIFFKVGRGGQGIFFGYICKLFMSHHKCYFLELHVCFQLVELMLRGGQYIFQGGGGGMKIFSR